MKDLQTTKDLVQSILERDEKARDNDNYLYFRVLNTIADEENINLGEIYVIDFLLNLRTSPFPPFESVRRTRQKVQEKCPWLCACEEVEQARAAQENVYIDFARA